MLERLSAWAARLKVELLTLWFCRNHPDTPWGAKLLAALVVAYAFSPIDLIPDFIPVIGYLDDLLLVPLGIYLTLRMIPDHVIAASRERARRWMEGNQARPTNYLTAVVIVIVWAALAYWAWTLLAEPKKP